MRPGDTALRERVSLLLKEAAAQPANGIRTLWTQAELLKMGAEPRASFAIDMQDGFYTGEGHDALLSATTSKGGHGFAPDRPALHASLVMAGPNVRSRGSVGIVRMTQIVPTIASWFDVSLSPKAANPLALVALPR